MGITILQKRDAATFAKMQRPDFGLDDGITGIQGRGIARLGSVTTSDGGIATICLGEELRIGTGYE